MAVDSPMPGAPAVSDENVERDAALWRALMAPKEGLRTGAEALRRTARGAAEDWLEARHGER
jgi:hypothetical protein